MNEMVEAKPFIVEESDKEQKTIDLSKDGGVLKTILRPGNDPSVRPCKGDTVFVHYVGRLKDTGEKFDSSRDRAEQFKFSLGKEQVIKGWDVAVASMCRGELALIECREDYAYGKGGQPPKIPAGATLVFEVELFRWEGEDLSPDRDGTIMKSIIQEGEKYNCPVENAEITVHAVGQSNGRVFYDRELTYVLGEGTEELLPDGVDQALRRVNKGEKCLLTLKGTRFTYGSTPPAEFGLEPNSELVFTLFLKDFEKVKQSWELLDNEKLEVAQQYKDRGTVFFQKGKYPLALSKYSQLISLMEHARPSAVNDDGTMKEKFEDCFVYGLLNCALVYLKMGENAECIKNCDKALEKRPNSVKALYRKSQALENRKEYDEAISTYKKVLTLEPENKAAQQQIFVCQQRLREQSERERKQFTGLFDRMRQVEKQ